ncbi:AroM protein [Scopulibacillus darangshiensis]|uniref:AroM protein n=1 Tax=Scopulibacillus darangshiensis TaxID=442528 RepID=A0A4R2P627_9BACL|nr:AroM family protein [Scopulibacillus darangshiensis]TCP29594.1 AroM protein [Scopulibacillus darangshiensis]
MKQTIGLLTIGQSPRVDMTPEMKLILGEHVELVEMGAIDGLSEKELQDFAPSPGGAVYISRLKDGRSSGYPNKLCCLSCRKRLNAWRKGAFRRQF